MTLENKKILLKNISTKRFDVSSKRTLLPNKVMEFDEAEALDLLSWEGDIVQVGENGSNVISTETISSLQAELKRLKAENENLKKTSNHDSDVDLKSVKEEAKALGIDVRGNPSIETLKAKIEEAKEATNTSMSA